MTDEENTILVQGRLDPLKEMLATLQAAGIPGQIVRPPDGDPNA